MMERRTDAELLVITAGGCMRRRLSGGELTCNLTISALAQRFGDDDAQLDDLRTCDVCLAEMELLQRSLA
jgi:hypothetical protein